MKTTEVFIPGDMAFIIQSANGESKTFPPGLQQVDKEHIEPLKAKIKKMYPNAVLPDGSVASEPAQPETIESLRERLRQMEAEQAAQSGTTQKPAQPTPPAQTAPQSTAPASSGGAPSGGQSDLSDADAASLVTESVWEKLRDAGLEDANAVKAATDDAILAINGIGPKLLKAIRKVVV